MIRNIIVFGSLYIGDFLYNSLYLLEIGFCLIIYVVSIDEMIVEHIDAAVVPPWQIGETGLLCSPTEVVISKLMIVFMIAEVGSRSYLLQSLSGGR